MLNNDWFSAFTFFIIASVSVLIIAYPVLRDFKKAK